MPNFFTFGPNNTVDILANFRFNCSRIPFQNIWASHISCLVRTYIYRQKSSLCSFKKEKYVTSYANFASCVVKKTKTTTSRIRPQAHTNKRDFKATSFFSWLCCYNFIYKVALIRKQRRYLSVFWVKLPLVYHTRWRLQYCPFYCWTSSKEALNTNFHSLWFDSTGNWTRVYRLNRHTRPLIGLCNLFKLI